MVAMDVPYTLEELRTTPNSTVYLEYRYPEYNSGLRRKGLILAGLASTKGPNRALYGKTWRCWAKKPSDDERGNAEWLTDVALAHEPKECDLDV